MNGSTTRLLFLVACAGAAGSPAALEGWANELLPANPNGSYPSIVVATDGTGGTHVAASTADEGAVYFLRPSSDSPWLKERVGQNGAVYDIEVDATGSTHLLGFDSTMSSSWIATRDAAGAWQSVSFEPYALRVASIAVDGRGVTHMTYSTVDPVDNNFRYLHYATLEGGVITSDEIIGDGPYGRIAVDAAGAPHVLFTTNAQALIYATKVGGSWQTETVAPRGQADTIVLDGAGVPYVAVGGIGSAPFVARRDASGWVVEYVPGSRVYLHGDTIALDALGQVHYAYIDNAYNIHHVVVGGGLREDTILGISDYTASIAVDPSGAVLVAYWCNWMDPANSGYRLAQLDRTPPTVSVSATPAALWPPNGQLVPVVISGQASDVGSGVESVTIVVSDEYGVHSQVLTSFGQTVELTAKRDATDYDGRIYTIEATVRDRAGNVSRASTAVTVPH